MSALMGLLLLASVKKDNHLTSLELFEPTYSGTRYVSVMSRERFDFLLNCLRFDDKSTRDERKERHKITASKAYEVKRCNTSDSALVSLIMGGNITDTPAMKRGRLLEYTKKEIKIQDYSFYQASEALTLNYYNPTGYKYVRQVFEDALPHLRTLAKWYEKTDAAPGFTAESFEILKKKYLATKTKIICTLIIDEMAILQQFIWNGKKTEGLVDYGVGSAENDKIASQAFVMMLVSLKDNWKLPLANFFVNGITAEYKAI
ncbi:unnamed protein product [Euphydryas editha]|uniref:Uncharacterized protein n=1 Tax=Euphydryas editha TaxID=104508 RepID=A0AAU9UTW3_EUPED|nr:unnamed protein product [Euphydryas editha]